MIQDCFLEAVLAVMDRLVLSDAQWRRIAPLIAHRPLRVAENLFGDMKSPIGRGHTAIDGGLQQDFPDFFDAGGLGKGADLVLKVNGQKVDEGKMKATAFVRFGVDTFGVGEDSGQPVTPDYEPPFKFTGTIEKVVIDLGPANLAQADMETINHAEEKARRAND